MKVLQLIDSLHAGGAERVAVNYANALSSRIDGSFLCATREEGLLKESLSTTVTYLFLKKKSTLDFKAIKTLNQFVKNNDIDIIHAHSSSFFLGTLIKILNPRIVLVWHDHYGNSEFLHERPKLVLKYCSRFFDRVLCVNTTLEKWAKLHLYAKSISYLPNFPVKDSTSSKLILKGQEGKRTVCLANLRPQKDHFTLLKAFKQIHHVNPHWSLHLVGKDFNDDYSDTIKAYIVKHRLENHVFIYGSSSDIHHILTQSTIGVLSSKSEGLPLALLEYGLAGLPVIVTNVGDCKQVVSNSDLGQLIPSENSNALVDAFQVYINDEALMRETGKRLQFKVTTSFSENKIMEELIKIYNQHLK
ncbi:glycosyl transferase [Yeosuana aromativorans]|uniref:Glycosyl transferase n=1 Tax=Yeosuana aromativorans TaxID=288019 RepID=A0A8J3BFC9_9FLAO|nr:glycosyltransferase family 4 protein [Yeosuana aromativorans]GGK17370.1 glycosyl transferase [Yeosuana aromativorans]